jgi:hypothetical protein
LSPLKSTGVIKTGPVNIKYTTLTPTTGDEKEDGDTAMAVTGKVQKQDVRKRASRLDMDRLVELAIHKKDDGTYYSHMEIAERMGCSRVAVTRALQRVPQWQLKDRDVEEYKRDRADIFAQAQQLILKYVTADKLKAASLQQLGTLFGIMYDKERLERGKATHHIAEVKQIIADPELKKLLQKGIEIRTKKLLEKTQTVQQPTEMATPEGDSSEAK